MGTIASHYSCTDQRKHQSCASLAFVRLLCGEFTGEFLNKWPVTRNMFPFDAVIMLRFIESLWWSLVIHLPISFRDASHAFGGGGQSHNCFSSNKLCAFGDKYDNFLAIEKQHGANAFFRYIWYDTKPTELVEFNPPQLIVITVLINAIYKLLQSSNKNNWYIML